MTPQQEDLTSALADIQAGNVTTGLDFLLPQAIRANDPAQCYGVANPRLIEVVAAATTAEQGDAERKLKAKYQGDFSRTQFRAEVRAAKAAALAKAPSESDGLLVSANGTPKPILANAIIKLKPLDLAYDSFSSVVIHKKPSPWKTTGRWSDLDDLAAANYLQHAGVSVTAATANEAAIYLAHQNPIHPVRDWLNSLEWDGEPRLQNLAGYYLDCDEQPIRYLREISVSWTISAVARAMRPGCQVKYMIVLEGPQDQGKSRALRALTNGHLNGDSGIQWFRDSLPDIDKDDIGLYMQGVWIIEVAELASIKGKEWERTKSFISSQTDTFRRKFGRNMHDYPRQCVFAGSTNNDHWAGDPTGMTRFWPLRPGKIKVDEILRDREQLWAEAVYLYRDGRKWWLDEEAEKLARGEQAERAPEDVWIDRVEKAAKAAIQVSMLDYVSVPEVLAKMGVPDDKHTSIGPQVGRCLTKLLWRCRRPSSTNGPRVRVYLRPGSPDF